MHVSLPCGRESLPLRLPVGAADRVRVLQSVSSSPVPDPARAVAGALGAPIGSLPLADLAKGRRSACVVVSDITRPVPNRLLLPPILRILEVAGISAAGVTILIATGMHRPNEGRELDELLGPEIARRYRVVNHDCRDRAALRRVGDIDGAAIEIDAAYLDADLKILTGLIEPHSFAGFSGGGKSVLPGLASFETMAFMHSYALVSRLDDAIGRVAGNPFREYIDRVCAAAGADFLLNVTVDRQRRICGVFAGHVREAFLAGCAAAGKEQILRLDRPADLVITTGGGYPLDQTFYQAMKGLASARQLVRPGGTLVLVAGCEQGLGGQGFCEVLRISGSPAGFRERYSVPAHFVVDQWAAQAYFRTLEHAGRVLLLSPGISAQDASCMGVEKLEDLDGLVAEAAKARDTVYVVPEGPYVTARMGEGPAG